ncbi:hypothetical protein KKF55_03805 [Patescibacteria group bacterium]|nr:hypothetical protein [Patescibacteria group bacterium]
MAGISNIADTLSSVCSNQMEFTTLTPELRDFILISNLSKDNRILFVLCLDPKSRALVVGITKPKKPMHVISPFGQYNHVVLHRPATNEEDPDIFENVPGPHKNTKVFEKLACIPSDSDIACFQTGDKEWYRA